MRAVGSGQPRPVGRALRRQFDPSGGPGRGPAVRPALRDRVGCECVRTDVACRSSGRQSSPIRHPALAQGGPARFRGGPLPDKRSKSPAARVAGPHKHRPPAYVVDGAADRRDLLRFPGPGELSVVPKPPKRIACPRRWLDKRPGGAYVAGADDGGGLCCVVHLVAGARSRSPRSTRAARPHGHRGNADGAPPRPPPRPAPRPAPAHANRWFEPPRSSTPSRHGRATAAPRPRHRRATAPPPRACSTRHPKIRQRVTAGR